MSRAARALILSLGIGAGAAIGATGASATTPSAPPTTPPTTTIAPTTTAPTTTAAPTTTVAAPPAGTRGNATQGSVAKPSDETWTARRIATLTGLAVIALAAAGYAYGRLRSAPPRHPDLEREPDDLDGAGHPHIGAAG
jgi:hypothetical protein